jgi:hypothetical protein
VAGPHPSVGRGFIRAAVPRAMPTLRLKQVFALPVLWLVRTTRGAKALVSEPSDVTGQKMTNRCQDAPINFILGLASRPELTFGDE